MIEKFTSKTKKFFFFLALFLLAKSALVDHMQMNGVKISVSSNNYSG